MQKKHIFILLDSMLLIFIMAIMPVRASVTTNQNGSGATEISVTDTGTGRYSSMVGFDQIFYSGGSPSSGIFTNVFGLVTQISSYTGSCGGTSSATYHPWLVHWYLYGSSGSSSNPIEGVVVNKGNDYSKTTTATWSISSTIKSDSFSDSFGYSLANSNSVSAYPVNYMQQSTVSRSGLTYHSIADGSVDFSKLSGTTTTWESDDVVSLSLYNNVLSQMGTGQFTLYLHVDYQWQAVGSNSWAGTTTCTTSFSINNQMGNPGIEDGTSGSTADGGISVIAASSSTLNI